MTDVEPFAFVVDAPVWSRIVGATLCAADGGPGLEAWLAAVDTDAPVRAVFTGLAVAARRT